MNAPSIIPTETLPVLIDRATAALDNARSSADVLEARDMARAAYDAAKSAGRIVKAKQAHDSILMDVHRSQAHALAIRARAEMKLADAYEEAQRDGIAPKAGGDRKSDQSYREETLIDEDAVGGKKALFEARRLRDAETAEPGLISRALDAMIERGVEPTRAALKREVIERPVAQKVMNPKALWLWGRLKDFEREGVLRQDPSDLLNAMTEPMRADVRSSLPAVIAFLSDLENSL